MIDALAFLEAGAGLLDCEVRTFTGLAGGGSGAIFSRCGEYRYLLWRHWTGGQRLLGWVMLNPSTADERDLDPTLARCMERSIRLGFDGMVIANLFALRSTDPRRLWEHPDPRGGQGLGSIDALAKVASPVVCGWGCHGYLEGRDKIVKALLSEVGADLQCLGLTKAGNPRHPLYLPYSAGLRPLEVS